MKTYLFTLKDKNINKKAARVVREMTVIFHRNNIDPDPIGSGELGFMADLPLDIFQDINDIANFRSVMRVETRT